MATEALRRASDALKDGDREGAWTALDPLLRYPSGRDLSDAQWAQGLGIFELIGSGSFSDKVTAAVTNARTEPSDARAQYELGFMLIDAQYTLIAASALARANTLAPGAPAIVNELASALEKSNRRDQALDVLRESYDARQRNWFTRYLYSFDALVTRHVVEAQQAFDALGSPEDENAQIMYDRLARAFARHERLAHSRPLDENDLRSWHYVVSGCVLTNVNRRAIDNRLHGRYSQIDDSDALTHESLIRAIVVLKEWEIRPEVCHYSADRSSHVLAEVWRQRTGIPVERFDPSRAEGSGLFIAYDMALADPAFIEAATHRRSGQLLVTHAMNWTRDAAVAPDITTFLYQRNTPSWSRDPATTAPENIAARIVASPVPQENLHDADALGSFAQLCGAPPVARRDRFLTSPL